jgi:ATP-dependent RNA helicase DDX23/PRP28
LNPSELVSSARQGRGTEKRLLFEWKPEDDTSAYDHDLYAGRLNTVQFGRGILGKGRTDAQDEIVQRKRHRAAALLEGRETHWRSKRLSEMTERDWRILKEDYSISTRGGTIPHPLRSWEEAKLSDRLQSAIRRFGYREPTPIQRQAIPIVLQGRDMLGVAETGSGKTLAFLLPFFEQREVLSAAAASETYDSEENGRRGPLALVLAPTRELVLQIESECAKFAREIGLPPPVAIVGGHAMAGQAFRLSEGTVDVVLATPGRLKDCLEQHVLGLSSCRYVVLDEADRMVDMGFEEDLNAILSRLPASIPGGLRVQTLLFSATMPPAVERIAKTHLVGLPLDNSGNKNPSRSAPSSMLAPAMVTIGTVGQAVDRIVQRVELVTSEAQKRVRLFDILDDTIQNPSQTHHPIIIFVNQKDTVDSIVRHLGSRGYRAIGLHGGRTQVQRESALQQLKESKIDVLVATDVASRGIDIPNVTLVLNYDMPSSIDTYIHRIGRTGRAGKNGLAHSFLFTATDSTIFYDLKQLLLKAPNTVCPPEFLHHEAANTKPGAAIQKKKSDETIYK